MKTNPVKQTLKADKLASKGLRVFDKALAQLDRAAETHLDAMVQLDELADQKRIVARAAYEAELSSADALEALADANAVSHEVAVSKAENIRSLIA